MSGLETGNPVRPDEAPGQPTPIWISKRLQTALLVVAFALLALAVWRVPSILAIVISAIALALILSHPVGWLARVMPRGLALLLTLLLLLCGLGLALVFLIPLLIDQLTEFIIAWPDIQQRLDQMLDDVTRELAAQGYLPDDGQGQSDRLREELSSLGQELAGNLLGMLLTLASGFAAFALQAFAIFIIAIYLLLDTRKARDAFISYAPERYRVDAAELWDAFETSISRYLGGVILVAAVSGGLSGIVLWALGVPYPLLLGLWVAFTSLIPIFGTYLGVVPALPLALAQSPTTAVLTVLAYIIIQNVQDNVLTPRIQGQTAHVHPIIILLAVLWTGLAFGLFWSVIAVPALVVIRVLFDFFRRRLRVRPEQDDRP